MCNAGQSEEDLARADKSAETTEENSNKRKGRVSAKIGEDVERVKHSYGIG